jgi:hypothetical protein
MPTALRQLMRRLPLLVVLFAIVLSGAGVLAFFWAFRPCPVQLQAGDILSYRLRTELREQGDDGAVVVDEQDIDCLCLNDQGDLAVVARNRSGEERLHLLRLHADGQAVPISLGQADSDSAATTIGFFDFNLLPLPVNAAQSWRVELDYGYLPVGQRRVQGEVRRVATGPNPSFELNLDTIEWIESQPYEHFRSLEDVTCRYRYRASQGVVDQARLRGRYGLEGRHAPRYVELTVDLQLLRSATSQKALALRDLVLVHGGSNRPLEYSPAEQQVLLERLYQAAGDVPRLQQIIGRHLSGEADAVPLWDPVSADPAWFVQVASVSPSRRVYAEAAAQALADAGWAARVVPRGKFLVIVIGPYAERQNQVRQDLEQHCGQRVLWVRLP